MRLYHGSYLPVRLPLVRLGRRNVDFGRGFYLTLFREQAVSWARTIAGRHRNALAVVSAFDFDAEGAKAAVGTRYKVFSAYDQEWLDYVVDSRRGGSLSSAYDVVEGGVANDNVIDTVEDYENGVIMAQQALGQLRYKKVNHQLAILSQEVIDRFLTFVEEEEVSHA